MENYSLHLNGYTIRREMHQGKAHIVVPTIMMKEGVHCGSHGPLLHPAEELGRHPGAWNGIPVIVYHPEDGEGNNISANAPQVIDEEVIGRVYHTTMSNGDLKAEAWLDELKLQQVSPETLEYINQNRPLDVSVGVFTDDEETSGVWGEENYSAIARNHRPDHLALLPGMQGACSFADGCGIRANQKGGKNNLKDVNTNALNYRETESTAWSSPTLVDFGVSESSWESLSREEKSKVASHYLIGSASAETFGDLYFPVVNPTTGKLNERALRAVIGGRGAQLTAVPTETRDAARRRAYGLLNREFDADLEIPETLSLINQLRKEGYSVVQINDDPGFQAIMAEVQNKLDDMDTDTRFHYLRELWNGYFIYEVRGNGNSTLLRRSYTVDNNNPIEFIGEPEEVVREVNYKLKTNKKGGVVTMKDVNGKCPCSDKVDSLIQGNSQFEEADREWLKTLSEAQLDKVAPVEVKVEGKVEGEPQMNQEKAVQVLKEELADPKKFMALLPAETKAQMEFGMQAYQSKRNELIDHISTNTEVYAKESLETMEIGELERLAQVVKAPADYSGMRTFNDSASGEDVLLPAGVEVESGKGDE